MIPERRLDRAERLLMLVIKAGYRERREWRERSREQDEKINILINTQMETGEQLNKLEAGHARLDKAMADLAEQHEKTEKKIAELAKEHEKTERSLKAFLDGLRKGHNGKSMN